MKKIKENLLLTILLCMAFALAVFIFTLFIREDHTGVVTNVCYNGHDETWEMAVNLDGGGKASVVSNSRFVVGDDIGISTNFFNTVINDDFVVRGD